MKNVIIIGVMALFIGAGTQTNVEAKEINGINTTTEISKKGKTSGKKKLFSKKKKYTNKTSVRVRRSGRRPNGSYKGY